MFEYKVKCRHRLGWKEIKLYADTDIEEFFNRNSINYVRNMTDTVEHRQLKEIERLNNIIKELEEGIENMWVDNAGEDTWEYQEEKFLDREEFLNKIKELKGEDKE